MQKTPSTEAVFARDLLRVQPVNGSTTDFEIPLFWNTDVKIEIEPAGVWWVALGDGAEYRYSPILVLVIDRQDGIFDAERIEAPKVFFYLGSPEQ
jgi:hypothetical protein